MNSLTLFGVTLRESSDQLAAARAKVSRGRRAAGGSPREEVDVVVVVEGGEFVPGG